MNLTKVMGFVLLVCLFFQSAFAQIPCSINDVDFSPKNEAFCETPAVVNFSADIDTKPDSIFLQGFPPTSNFQNAFTHTFNTENNGCTYALRISGTYSIWGNPTERVDARYLYQLDGSGQTQQDPVGMDISQPDFFTPSDYNPDHLYWFFYEGDGRDVSFSFMDGGRYDDNDGDMTFDWFLVPCFDTIWTIDGIQFNGADMRGFSFQQPGSFDVSLEIIDRAAGCMDSASGQVLVGEKPEATVATTDSCPGDDNGTAQATISDGTMPFQFQWSDGGPDASLNNMLPPGNHELIITDVIGCGDTVNFSIDEKTFPMLMIENTDPTCQGRGNGLFEILDPEARWTYSLDGNNFQSTPLFQNLDVGTFVFFIDDGDGCIFSDSTTLTAPNGVQIDMPSQIISTQGADVVLEPIITGASNDAIYFWSPQDDLTCTDCPTTVANPTKTTIYTLVITEPDGCESTASVTIRIDEPSNPNPPIVNDSIPIFIPSAFSPNNDGINDYLSVFGDASKIAQVKTLAVFDRWGGQVFTQNDFDINDEILGWNGEWKGQELKTGIYIYFAEVEWVDGSTTVLKGDVSLVR